MRKFIEEFKEFAIRGNVMDMAVGVIIGGAFSGIVTSFTDNIINPILKFVTTLGKVGYGWGDISGFISSFLSAVVNFIIMAFILFVFMRGVNTLLSLGKKKHEEAPATKKCPFCQSEIDINAVRCPNCTGIIDQAKLDELEAAENIK